MNPQERPGEEQTQTASGRLIQLDASGDSQRLIATNTSRRRKRQRMPGLAVLPSALTLGNAICGVAALIELAKAYAALATGDFPEVTLRIGYASLLVGGGMLFDAMDGKVARMTATTGRFGAELDSLCDAVTFGVAPAMMLRVGGEFFFARPPFALPFDTKLLWAVCGLYACCAILRLARFNVETAEDDDHTVFHGLPSPAAAASVCALMLGCTWFYDKFSWFDEQPFPWILRVAIPAVGAFIGLMMVTRIRYVHAFNRLVSRKQSLRTLVFVMLVVVLVVIFIDYWKLMVPALMLGYVLSGPIYFAYRFLRGRGVLGRRLAIAERRRRRNEEMARDKGKDAGKGSATGPA
ncbi:MAG: phosphatidylcholine/phosphatidylserine synthase [Planctomycetes bacterium]|nr:phosphatidylcholine/phosphatidylserine synthase [Planctomycetota bacterium]MCW8134913.1 phosphatidylcholine/phosphatidylserine synthase [Planctomycetota bacterium]